MILKEAKKQKPTKTKPKEPNQTKPTNQYPSFPPSKKQEKV